jgi:hypothetical protein
LREKGIRRIGRTWNRNGFNFVPLVQEKYVLRCSLEVLFLRIEDRANFILQGGDLDARLKNLFDGLRITAKGERLPLGVTPEDGEDPFFCLLEDDNLISDVRVNADQLLCLPGKKAIDPHDVYLQITVRLNARAHSEYSWMF